MTVTNLLIPDVSAPVVTLPVAPSGTIHELEPWKRSFFYCAPGEIPTLLWVLGIHAIVIAGLIFLPFPGWIVFGVALALLWLGGLGTTVAYHRALSHRSLNLHPAVEHTLIFFAMLNGSGNPLTWVANHRYHHRHSDSDGDVSSPRQGFWWAHLRWLWQWPAAPIERYCRDMNTPAYRFWGKVQVTVLALSLLGGLALWPFLGWKMALATCVWAGALRCAFALHVQCTINSFCHMGTVSEQGGSELNLWWLLLPHLGQGENWHFNHHANASNPKLGRGMQLDVGWMVIKGLSYIGLATDIKSTKPRIVPPLSLADETAQPDAKAS